MKQPSGTTQSSTRPQPGYSGLPAITLGSKPTYIKVAEDVSLFDIFVNIEQHFETCFLFESLGEPSPQSRYSVVGFAPEHVISARNGLLHVDGQAYDVGNPYFALRQMMPRHATNRNYAGGLAGYIGYDTINFIEPTLSVQTHPEFDAFMFGVYTDGLVLDTQTAELFYFYYNSDRSDLIRKLIKKRPAKTSLAVTHLGDTLSKAEHTLRVKAVKEQIAAGNIFQCEVGFKTMYQLDGDAMHIYRRLRDINPSPYMYFVKFDDKRIIGSSPESLLELQAGALATRPLAGTIRRGQSEAEDRQLARQLLNDPKEIAEHNMLVDLHRNDIGRVAQFGSVRVRDLKSIKQFSHVQHIGSEITGSLRPDEDMFSALAANFPAGTLSGAPKIEAMKIIDANEPEGRGPYGGAVGHFGFNGDCTFAIAIRSLFVSGDRAYAQTSGGIVHDSQPTNEYDEIKRKLAAMHKAVMS